jgi:type I restriction enzyme, S subunit
MTKYDKYKPSVSVWLDKIPNNWEMKKSKYVFSYTTGFTPPTGQNEYYNGEFIWVTISDMDRKIIIDSSNKISQLAIAKLSPSLTRKESLLFSFKLSVGKVAFAGNDLYTNEAIISIAPSDNISLHYLYYILPHQLLQNANENIYGAKILNQELIRNALITVPPITEQTAMATYLDEKTAQIDNFISAKKKLIKLLKEERAVIINNAVTKGINPDAKLKPSGIDWLGDIPVHWQMKKLKYLVGLRDEAVDDCDFKISVENIESGSGRLIAKNNEVEYSGSLSKFYTADTIFNKLRPYLHKVYFAENDGGLYGELLILFSRGELFNKFLFYRMFSKGLIDVVDSSTYGTKMPRANWDNFISHLLIAFPKSLAEQEAIVEYIDGKLEGIYSTIAKIEKEIKLIQEYRTALIGEVVTGKIKVT